MQRPWHKISRCSGGRFHVSSWLRQQNPQTGCRQGSVPVSAARCFPQTENSGLRARINTADAKIERLEMETEAGQRDRTKVSQSEALRQLFRVPKAAALECLACRPPVIGDRSRRALG